MPLKPLVHSSALRFLESRDGMRLRQDLIAWCRWRKIAAETREERARALEWHLAYLPEFRALFDYRAEKGGMPYCRDMFSTLPRTPELHITTPEIGGGLRIQHGSGRDSAASITLPTERRGHVPARVLASDTRPVRDC